MNIDTGLPYTATAVSSCDRIRRALYRYDKCTRVIGQRYRSAAQVKCIGRSAACDQIDMYMVAIACGRICHIICRYRYDHRYLIGRKDILSGVLDPDPVGAVAQVAETAGTLIWAKT